MKAERKQPKFEPVVITLKSEDELNYLWHCLDLKKSDVKDLANQSVPFPENVDDDQMFEELDKIVRPEKHK